MAGIGWAVREGRAINVRSVCETRRGAIVNWLLTEKRELCRAVTTDEQIENMWNELKGTAEVTPVNIYAAGERPPEELGAMDCDR